MTERPVDSAAIAGYVRSLDILGDTRDLKIHRFNQGTWNFNFFIETDSKKYVLKAYNSFRGRQLFENSPETEYLCLKFLDGLEIAPTPIAFDAGPNQLGRPVLVYKYVEGKGMRFDKDSIKGCAKLLAKTHSADYRRAGFLKEKSYRACGILQELHTALDSFKGNSITGRDAALYSMAMDSVESGIRDVNGTDYPRTIIHTDPVPSNFIVSGKRVTLIDWQGPAIGDPSFDVWAFTSEPYNLWDLKEPMGERNKQLFLDTYLKARNDPTLVERMDRKAPLYYLYLGIHAMIKHHDYVNGKIPEDVVRGRRKNFERYAKTKNIILKILQERFGVQL